MRESIKIKYEKIREVVIVMLLSLWMLIPVLKDLNIIWYNVTKYEYLYIKIVGVVGLIFLIVDIYCNLKNKKNIKKYDQNMLPITILGIFMIWTFISAIFAPNRNYAFYGTEYRKEGYITYLAYAGFFSCALFLKSKKSKEWIMTIFIIAALLNIIMLELVNRGMFEKIITMRLLKNTVFSQFNHYGYYLLLAMMTSNFLYITQKNKIKKIFFILSYAVFCYYLILNNTFGCHLACFVTLVLFMIYSIIKKKKIAMAIVSIIIFVTTAIITPKNMQNTKKNINNLFRDIKNIVAAECVKWKDIEGKEEIIEKAEKSGTDRMALWKNGIKFFMERPILGYGPENLGEKYEEVKIKGQSGQDRPHNLLIQVATTSGIIGLVSYTSAIGIILIRAIKNMKVDNSMHIISFFVVIAYLISAMFGNSMYYTSPYFFIFLGMLMYENINVNIEEKR